MERTRAALAPRLGAFLSTPHTRIYSDRRFLALGAGVVAIGAVWAVQPEAVEDAVPFAVDAEASAPAAISSASSEDLSRFDLFFHDGSVERLRTETFTLKSGDSLGPLLQRNGVAPGAAYQVTEACADVWSPRKLRAGQSFQAGFEGDRLVSLAFKPDVERTVVVERGADGFSAREVAAEFRYQTLVVRSRVDTSLYVDAKKLGAPDRVIQQFARVFEYSVDFQRDIQPGDDFEMVFEAALDRDGDIVRSRNMLFASFAPAGDSTDYYLFADANGDENYYDADGKTAKRKLRATPVNGARLSSGFGSRRHPISGFRRMHKGVDFAAPSGTPIYAAGTGVVERANRYGGFGNYVRIRHSGGYKTAYAHLKGFARGIKKGTRVKQDQVIGYVGSTGRSTGPHLHYEVHLNGKAVNPRTLAQLPGKPLADSQMAAFAERRAEVDRLRLEADVLAPVAVLADDASGAPSGPDDILN